MTKHEITIVWGSIPELDDTPITYSFKTKKEFDAFMAGVEAAEGWLDYTTVGPGCDFEVWPPKEEKTDA